MDKRARDYLELREQTAEMCTVVMGMFDNVLKAIATQDTDIATKVIRQDKEANRLDIELDEKCLKFLALYSPKSTDLRQVVACLRLVVDLEFIGDHCKVIAKQVTKHNLAHVMERLDDFKTMTDLTQKMLKDSVDAMFNDDVAKSEQVLLLDEQVSKYQSIINKNLLNIISASSGQVKVLMSIVNIIRRVERIADHAKNIAEMVPYIVDGTIVRHKDLRNDTNTPN